MKVCFKNISKTHLRDSIEVIKDFCQLLQSELGLKKDVHIHFTNERNIPMTTGVRLPHHEIFVLVHGRMLIDILRTLGHEWVHEYQHQIMGIPEDEKIQDVGGPEENMASALASIYLKKFQKQFPKYAKKLFGEQILRAKRLIKELSPDSEGFKDILNSAKNYPEVLSHLKFTNLKSLEEYLLDANYQEFDEIRKEIQYFTDRRKRYLKSEMDEIERVVQDLNRDENIDVSVADVYRAFDSAKEMKLPDEIWSKLENTESNEIKKGEMKKVMALAKKYNKQDPRELRDALRSGDYKRPLILKFGDRYHLVAGNTRLCTAAAMGIKPQVLIGEIF